jgi:hypothetical protein
VETPNVIVGGSPARVVRETSVGNDNVRRAAASMIVPCQMALKRLLRRACETFAAAFARFDI